MIQVLARTEAAKLLCCLLLQKQGIMCKRRPLFLCFFLFQTVVVLFLVVKKGTKNEVERGPKSISRNRSILSSRLLGLLEASCLSQKKTPAFASSVAPRLGTPKVQAGKLSRGVWNL